MNDNNDNRGVLSVDSEFDIDVDIDRRRLVEEQERHRRQEIIGAMSVIPIDMDFNDGFVLLSLLYTIRKQKGRDRRYTLSDFWNVLIRNYKTDETDDSDSRGRITMLCLKPIYMNEDAWYFSLPPIVERLQRLKEIELHCCRLIPKELDNLPFLEKISFKYCIWCISDNLPVGIQLAGLKSLQLEVDDFVSKQMFELVTNLVSLEELIVEPNDFGDVDILHKLQNDDICFQKSLKVLNLDSWKLKKEGLKTLLFNILPRFFPNLRELLVRDNEIESLQTIEMSISKNDISPKRHIPDNSLRRLILHGNPVFEKMKNGDHKEKDALLTILNTFNEISYIGESCGSDVEYLLRINHAGRKFVTTAMAFDNNSNSSNSESSSPPRMKRINPKLWPTILKRAYEKSDTVDGRKKCATGFFHLLRNGSVLEDIVSNDINNNIISNKILPSEISVADGDATKRGQKRKLD